MQEPGFTARLSSADQKVEVITKRIVVGVAYRLRYAPVMIAMIKCVTFLLLCALLAGAPARAQEQRVAPDFTTLDAEVERGVQAYDAGDFATAKAILLPLAQAGHPKAMNMVGLMHDGTGVFPDDPALECDWYERAANAGYVSGIYNLSTCYNHGRGRPKDQKLMLHWRIMAAERGFTAAMINLASMDQTQGQEYRRWMTLAAEHGSRYALVSLWLQKYEYDAWSRGMTLQDIVCVSWRILILDKEADYCD